MIILLSNRPNREKLKRVAPSRQLWQGLLPKQRLENVYFFAKRLRSITKL